MLAPFKALLFLGLTTLIVLGSPAPAGQARRIFDKNRSLQPKLFDARRTTNAERLANNLPPIRPRKLWDGATGAQTANKARASPSLVFYNVHVYDAGGLEGTFLGYIRQELGPIGHCAFTLDATAAAKVYWQDDGNMINPLWTLNYLSFRVYNIVPPINNGNRGIGYFAPVPYTPPGSEPVQNIPGSSNLGESSIWTKDSTTGEVTALWINAGGASNEDQFIVYDPEEGLDSEIFLMSSTGAAFWSKQTVRLFLAPVDPL